MSPTVDKRVFGPLPARDPRFLVKETWAGCLNLPDDHPQKTVEFFHRQMNEEMNGLENAARNLADYPDADWDVRMCIARQAYDEARHVEMFRRIFEKRGGRVGQYPVLNFQYSILGRIEGLVCRLAVQNRSFEAGGIDAVGHGIEEARANGDEELALLFEAQQADEITHVRFANEYVRLCIRRDPRVALQIARALTQASAGFHTVMGLEATSNIRYSVDAGARREAGFDAQEISVAREQAALRRQPMNTR
jgi:uncharacterized ferritin-like protein (DUF455 family)